MSEEEEKRGTQTWTRTRTRAPLNSPNVVNIKDYQIEADVTSIPIIKAKDLPHLSAYFKSQYKPPPRILANARANLSNSINKTFATIADDLEQALDKYDVGMMLSHLGRINEVCQEEEEGPLLIGRIPGLCRVLSLVLAAVKENPSATEAVLLSIHLLCGDNVVNAKNINFFMAADIYSALMETLRHNSKSGPVCVSVYRVISDLAYDRKQRYQLANAGCCEAILETVGNHVAAPIVAEQALQAFGQLFNEPSCCEILMKEMQLFNLLEDILTNHNSHDILLQTACGVFGQIASHPDYTHHFRNEDVFRMISGVLRTHQDISSACLESSLFLMSLVEHPLDTSPVNSERFMELAYTVIENLVAVVQEHCLDSGDGKNMRLMRLAIWNVVQLTAYGESSQHATVYSLGTCRFLTECFKVNHNLDCQDQAEEQVCSEMLCLAVSNMISTGGSKLSLLFGHNGLCKEAVIILKKLLDGDIDAGHSAKYAVCNMMNSLCCHNCSFNQLDLLKLDVCSLVSRVLSLWSSEECNYQLMACLAAMCGTVSKHSRRSIVSSVSLIDDLESIRDLSLEYYEKRIHELSFQYLRATFQSNGENFDDDDISRTGCSDRVVSVSCWILCNAASVAVASNVDAPKLHFDMNPSYCQLLLQLMQKYCGDVAVVAPVLSVMANSIDKVVWSDVNNILLQEYSLNEISRILLQNLSVPNENVPKSDRLGTLIISGGQYLYNIVLLHERAESSFSDSTINAISDFALSSLNTVDNNVENSLLALFVFQTLLDKCDRSLSVLSSKLLPDIFESVFCVLDKWHFEKRIVQLSTFIISRIASSEAFRQFGVSISLGNLKAIHRAFHSQFSHPHVCVYIIIAVGSIFSPTASNIQAHGAEVAKLITKCLAENLDNETFVELSSFVLCDLCKSSDSNVDAYLESEGCVMTLSCIKRCWLTKNATLFLIAVDVVEACIRSEDNKFSKFSIKNFCLFGGCEIFVHSLKLHWDVNDALVKSTLLKLMTSFCSAVDVENGPDLPSAASTSIRNISLFLNEGLMSTIGEAIENYMDSGEVVESCLNLVTILSKIARGREECCSGGMTNTVVACLEKSILKFSSHHCTPIREASGELNVMVACCKAVSTLSCFEGNRAIFEHTRCCEMMGLLFGLNVVVASDTSHASELGSVCCEAVTNLCLCSDPSLKERIQQSLCHFKVLKFLLTNILEQIESSEMLLAKAFEALASLVSGNQSLQVVFDCNDTGFTPMLTLLLSCSARHDDVSNTLFQSSWVHCVAVLLTACADSDLTSSMGEQIYDTAVRVIDGCLSSRQTIRWACEILCSLTNNLDIIEFLDKRGAHDLTMRCLREHINDPEIARKASDVTSRLSKYNKKKNVDVEHEDQCAILHCQLKSALESHDEALFVTTAASVQDLISQEISFQHSFGSGGMCELLCEHFRPAQPISSSAVSRKQWSQYAKSHVLQLIFELCRENRTDTPSSTTSKSNVNRFLQLNASDLVYVILKENWHLPRIAEFGMASLHALLSRGKECKLPSVSTSRIAISILKRHHEDAAVVSRSCDVVSALSSISSNSTLFDLCDICDVLVDTLNSWSKNKECSLSILLAISSIVFTQSVSLAEHFFRQNSILVVLTEILRSVENLDCPLLISTTCVAMTNFILLFEVECQSKLLELGGAEAIGNLLKVLVGEMSSNPKDTEKVAYNCLDLLAAFCLNKESIQNALCEQSALAQVISLSEEFKSDVNFSKMGCLACHALLADSLTSGDKLVEFSNDIQGMIVGIVKIHGDEVDLMSSALVAVDSFCSKLCECDTTARAVIMEHVVSTGLLDSLSGLFQNHCDSADIVIKCCNVFNDMLRPHVQVKEIVDENDNNFIRLRVKFSETPSLFDAIVSGLYAHIKNAKVVSRICSLVIKITLNFAANVSLLVNHSGNFCGAMKRLYRADKKFLSEVGQIVGKVMLNILCVGSEETISRVVQCDMADVLLPIARDQSGQSDAITIITCRVWLELLYSTRKSDTAVRNVTKGGDIVGIVFAMLQSHPSNRKLLSSACNALASFLNHDAENAWTDAVKTSLSLSGRPSILSSLLDEFSDSISAQLTVLGLIGKCCHFSSVFQVEIFETKVPGTVSDLLNASVASRNITLVKKLLAALDPMVRNCSPWQIKLYPTVLSSDMLALLNLTTDISISETPANQKWDELTQLLYVWRSLISGSNVEGVIVNEMISMDVCQVLEECVFAESNCVENIPLLLSAYKFLSCFLARAEDRQDSETLVHILSRAFSALRLCLPFVGDSPDNDENSVKLRASLSCSIFGVCETLCKDNACLKKILMVDFFMWIEMALLSQVPKLVLSASKLVRSLIRAAIGVGVCGDVPSVVIGSGTSIALLKALSNFSSNSNVVQSICGVMFLLLEYNDEIVDPLDDERNSNGLEFLRSLQDNTSLCESALSKCLGDQVDTDQFYCDICILLALVVKSESPQRCDKLSSKGNFCSRLGSILEKVKKSEMDNVHSLLKVFSAVFCWSKLSPSFRSELSLTNIVESVATLFNVLLSKSVDNQKGIDGLVELLGKVLKEITFNDSSNAGNVMILSEHKSVCPTALKALDERSDMPSLVIDMCQFIYNLCAHQASRKKIVPQVIALRGVDLLLDVLEESHIISTKVVISICGSLEILGSHSLESRRIILQDDSKKLLDKMNQIFSDDGDVMASLIGLVAMMKLSSEDNVVEIQIPHVSNYPADVFSKVRSVIPNIFSKSKEEEKSEKEKSSSQAKSIFAASEDNVVDSQTSELVCQLFASLNAHVANENLVSKLFAEVDHILLKQPKSLNIFIENGILAKILESIAKHSNKSAAMFNTLSALETVMRLVPVSTFETHVNDEVLLGHLVCVFNEGMSCSEEDFRLSIVDPENIRWKLYVKVFELFRLFSSSPLVKLRLFNAGVCRCIFRIINIVAVSEVHADVSLGLRACWVLLSVIFNNDDLTLFGKSAADVNGECVALVLKDENMKILKRFFEKHKASSTDVCTVYLSICCGVVVTDEGREEFSTSDMCKIAIDCISQHSRNLEVCFAGTLFLTCYSDVDALGNSDAGEVCVALVRKILALQNMTAVSRSMSKSCLSVLLLLSNHENFESFLTSKKSFIDAGYQTLIGCMREKSLHEGVSGIQVLCIRVIGEVLSRSNEKARDEAMRTLSSMDFDGALRSVLESLKLKGGDSSAMEDVFCLLCFVLGDDRRKHTFQRSVLAAIGNQRLVTAFMSDVVATVDGGNGEAVNASDKLVLCCEAFSVLAGLEQVNEDIRGDLAPSLILRALAWGLNSKRHVDRIGFAAVQATFDVMKRCNDSVAAFGGASGCEAVSKYLATFDNVGGGLVNDSVGFLTTVEVIWVLCTDSGDNRDHFAKSSVHTSLVQYWGQIDESQNLSMAPTSTSSRVERAVLACIRYLCKDNTVNRTLFSDSIVFDAIVRRFCQSADNVFCKRNIS